MAIIQISRIQHRRGLQENLPQLASAEFGWAFDSRKLYIGNGTLDEGAPSIGVTEVLTEHSDVATYYNPTYTFKGLTSGFQVQTGPDAQHPIYRTLQDKLDDVVSVKDFGAIGDGVADDTLAIQRALDRTYGTGQSTLFLYHHRTINFPAGNYKITATLNIPPYSLLKGEGKRTTIIQGSFEGPLAQLVDGFGQSGNDFGGRINGVAPDNAEYHLSDMSFLQQSPSYSQPCVTIDGCWTATFNRVMFRGLTDLTTADTTTSGQTVTNYYNTDRGVGVAAVWIPNGSNHTAVRNVVFLQCDFLDHNYGIELYGECTGIAINNCYFDHLYQGVVIGDGEGYGQWPRGVAIYNNYFRYSGAEAIKSYGSSKHVMSSFNICTGSNLADWAADTPLINPAGVAQGPAISFSYKDCSSIGDSFDRDEIDYALFPNVELNGKDSFVLGQAVGLVNGRKTEGQGHTLSLPSTFTFITTGITFIPTSYTNLEFNYVVTHLNQQRVGKIIVTRVGSKYVWTDDYTETDSTGVVFQINTTSGDIEYTSIASTSTAQLTYNLSFFTPGV
jgi:hypothetical protein